MTRRLYIKPSTTFSNHSPLIFVCKSKYTDFGDGDGEELTKERFFSEDDIFDETDKENKKSFYSTYSD